MQLIGVNSGPIISKMFLQFLATLYCEPFWKLGILA
jgi:hypothetical protein